MNRLQRLAPSFTQNFNLGRIVAIAANVFREAIRNRVLYTLVVYAVLMLLNALIIPQLASNAQFKMMADLGLAVMELLTVAIAIMIGASTIEKEIDKRTVLLLLSKPISRSEFILGKFCGLGAVLGVAIALMLSTLIVLIQVKSLELSINLACLSAGFLWLRVLLLTAIAILFGTFSSSLLSMLLTLVVYIAGSLSQDFVRLSQTTENFDLEQLTRWLYLFLPDMSRLDVKNDVVYGFAGLPGTDILVSNAVYGVVYTIAILALAIGIFSRRQF